MRKLLFLLVALVLVACGGPAATEAEDTAPTAEAPSTTDDASPTAEESDTSTGQTFIIVSEESEARFYIDEVLFGADKRVEGVTNAISGSFTADYSAPTEAQFAPITIDATSFITDNDNRNRAIQRFVLETSQAGNETITFEIESVEGLPETVTVGETYDVTLSGSLTVHGVTNPVSFSGQLTPVSEERIEGSFSQEIAYADWDISVPQPPSVTFVADTLLMEFDLVALGQ